ncbi:MAG: anaerobic glycerol-3-phosphate dehydrogenase subunit GlpA [Anaerolineae bacterium]
MTEYDVLIIGGGATGGGTALDLALRGLKVALIERADLTDGTSGRYHGLLHSGGRYAVRDPESARECIAENRILRKIVPHAIEDTGGFFVQTPEDDPAYAEQWVTACGACGIPIEEISPAQALKEEPALNPQIRRVFRVPDAACDSFDILTALGAAIRQLGGDVFTYQEVVGLQMAGDRVVGAKLRSRRTGEERQLAARMVVNAAGAWAGQIAAMAGCQLTVRPSKGTMVAMAYRFVNTIINRLHKPGDGDILVPVGTVAVIGTTSVNVPDPNETGVEPWEVQLMLQEGEKMVPGFSQARALRAWAGVRPLYEEGSSAEGREAKRTFAVLDHAQRDGIGGLVTVVGGKFTTYRLMAERAADAVCAQLGVNKPCVTKDFVLPDVRIPINPPKPHRLGHRLEDVEQAAGQDQLICECELVTRGDLERAAAAHGDVAAPWILDDLRRDLRLGMGPCQGGFCGYRAAGILHESAGVTADAATVALADFAQRRWKGQRPLLWGQGLRQALLDEEIYRGILGLDQLGGDAHG